MVESTKKEESQSIEDILNVHKKEPPTEKQREEEIANRLAAAADVGVTSKKPDKEMTEEEK